MKPNRASIREEMARRAQRLFRRTHAKPFFLAWAGAAFNQLDGVNALMYYLNPAFTMAGFTKVSGDLQALAVGVANLLATVFGHGFEQGAVIWVYVMVVQFLVVWRLFPETKRLPLEQMEQRVES